MLVVKILPVYTIIHLNEIGWYLQIIRELLQLKSNIEASSNATHCFASGTPRTLLIPKRTHVYIGYVT